MSGYRKNVETLLTDCTSNSTLKVLLNVLSFLPSFLLSSFPPFFPPFFLFSETLCINDLHSIYKSKTYVFT